MRQDEGPARFFGEAQAASYDANFARLAPLKDALHLCMLAVMRDLRPDARVLCVGAGTGAELLYLARAFPGWSFVLVEPSGPMLQRCREHAAEAGLEPRCRFHEGYLGSLPPTDGFDAATAILVSQFLLEREARRGFFSMIAERLRPRGLLVSADLAGRISSLPSDGVADAWMALMRYNGLTEEALAGYQSSMESFVAVQQPEAVEAIIASAGFDAPVRFCQTLLIHAWYARRR
jgi:tRNA (cmo5U34)-methyltransferase